MLIESVSPVLLLCLFSAQTASNAAQRQCSVNHRDGLPFSVLYYSDFPTQNRATLDMYCAFCVNFPEVQRANFFFCSEEHLWLTAKKKKNLPGEIPAMDILFIYRVLCELQKRPLFFSCAVILMVSSHIDKNSFLIRGLCLNKTVGCRCFSTEA